MPTKMYKEFINNLFTYASGIACYYFALIQVHIPDVILKFLIMVLSALFASFLAHLGKLMAVWVVKRIRKAYTKFKTRKNNL